MAIDERLRARVGSEQSLLAKTFPNARIDPDSRTLTLLDWKLSPGWNRSSTDVLVSFPRNYPAGCPDNVCVHPDLLTASGQPPGNSQGIQHHAGRAWLQLSWHIEATDWRPTAEPAIGSNLLSYLIGALTRFDEPS